MNKFKVGDPVKIRKGITNEDMGTNYPRLDLDKVYHISAVDGTLYHLKETHPGYCFCTDWLEPDHGIERVLFNKPATIVFWTDGTKTVVKCRKGDKWDAEKGLAMACAKKLLGNDDGYHKTLATYYKKERVWEEEMDTQQIRAAVSRGCIAHPGCDGCPCNPSKGGTCYMIAAADRGQLIAMLKEFEKADKWSYEDWRARHA